MILHVSKSSIQKIAIENAKSQFITERNYFKFYLDNLEAKLEAVKDSTIFNKYIKNGKITDKNVQDLFLSIARSDNFIMQLRMIDINGQELLRVDRNVCYALPYLVTKTKLQNKKNRYYFKEIIQLQKDKIWTSNLDLNIEHGKIEKPYKPVIRIGTPVYNNEKKVGILIINVFMKKILDQIRSSKLYNIYLVDKDGYFIIHPDKKYNFSRYLDTKVTLKDFFPHEYKKILSQNSYKSKTLYAAKLNFQNPDGLKMIIEPTEEFIKSNENELYKSLSAVLGLLILLAIPLSLFISRPYAKLKAKTDAINNNLEEKVQQKTKELTDLNKTLEEKIIERTNEQNVLLSLFDLGDAVLFKWRNDETWSVEYVSKSVEKLLRYTQNDFLSGRIKYAELIHEEDLPRVIQEVNSAVEKRLYFFTHQPYRIKTHDNQIKWIHDSTAIVRNSQGDIVNFVGYLTDITDLKNSELKLENLSVTDTLTQIHNRLFLDKVLKKQHYRLLRNDERCSIILMDIDYFKKINDRYGHLTGDKVLKELSKLIESNLRESDTFGRWGGEEFMIITPHTSKEDARVIAEKLRKIIENHSFSDIEHVTVSFGVTECSKEHTLDTDISLADKALYLSKQNGRNRVSVI